MVLERLLMGVLGPESEGGKMGGGVDREMCVLGEDRDGDA